jgi:hypothetical protein
MWFWSEEGRFPVGNPERHPRRILGVRSQQPATSATSLVWPVLPADRSISAVPAGRASRLVDTNAVDLVCRFDFLHEPGRSLSAATHAREHLRPGGTVLLVEPFVIDGRPENPTRNPMAAMLSTAASTIWVPNSLSGRDAAQRSAGDRSGWSG